MGVFDEISNLAIPLASGNWVVRCQMDRHFRVGLGG